MKKTLYIPLLAFLLAASPFQQELRGQVYQLTDFVEIPGELGVDGTDCFITFHEEWTFLEKGALVKKVSEHEFTCSREPVRVSLPENGTRIRDISYEFVLLDPHLEGSGNRAFPGPDSMDLATRRLQSSLIELIRSNGTIHERYDAEKQLLSVWFHEEWILADDPRVFMKMVRGITPVIWQERRTSDGESVVDGDTGLPVYYKNPLEKITLRRP